MSNCVTIVIRIPNDTTQKLEVQHALKLLEPYRTGMSLEDEMTVLEMIEQHPGFPEHIATEARAQTQKLHAAAPHDSAVTNPQTNGHTLIMGRSCDGMKGPTW